LTGIFVAALFGESDLMKLKHLIDQPGKLPTIPKVGQQLIASLSDDDVSVVRVAELLALDPVLSARLLRLANSAFFRVSHTIGTVDGALQILGLMMARNLVIGASMAAAFKLTPGLDLKQFWRYTLYTSCASRWLACRADVDADAVFTLGVLHGIGQLHMHAVMPYELAGLNWQMGVLDGGRAQRELDLFGFHYGDVSAELAQVWNFPLSLVDALRHVAQPLASPNFSEPAAWVHMGAWHARGNVLGLRDQEHIASYPAEVARRLFLAPDWALALAEPGRHNNHLLMPPLVKLSDGLEAMFD